MSHLVQCNRCRVTIEANEENFGLEWSSLKDEHSNAIATEETLHLCTECTQAFEVFMQGPGAA